MRDNLRSAVATYQGVLRAAGPVTQALGSYKNLAVFTLQTLLCYIYLSLCSLKTFEAIHISQGTCIM